MDWGREEFIVDDNIVFGSRKELMINKIIQIKSFSSNTPPPLSAASLSARPNFWLPTVTGKSNQFL
jgi:hypothetical protein